MSAELHILQRRSMGGYEGDMRLLRRGLRWLDHLTEAQKAQMRSYGKQSWDAVIENEAQIRRVANALSTAGSLTGAEIQELL